MRYRIVCVKVEKIIDILYYWRVMILATSGRKRRRMFDEIQKGL